MARAARPASRAWGAVINLNGPVLLNANGHGGNASSGAFVDPEDTTGTGGSGYGGLTYVEADSVTEFGNRRNDQWRRRHAPLRRHRRRWRNRRTETLTSRAMAAAGVGGTYSGEFDSAGAFVLADANGAVLSLGNVTVTASGTGGAGGTGGTGQAGGNGGVGFGGTAETG